MVQNKAVYISFYCTFKSSLQISIAFNV